MPETAKQVTRAQAEKQISNGADPTEFSEHPNYHVRRKAWVKMGRPVPKDASERHAFLLTLISAEAAKLRPKAQEAPNEEQAKWEPELSALDAPEQDMRRKELTAFYYARALHAFYSALHRKLNLQEV